MNVKRIKMFRIVLNPRASSDEVEPFCVYFFKPLSCLLEIQCIPDLARGSPILSTPQFSKQPSLSMANIKRLPRLISAIG